MRTGSALTGTPSRVNTPPAIALVCVVPSKVTPEVDVVSVIVARHVVARPTRLGSHETDSVGTEMPARAGINEATIAATARAPAVRRTTRPRTEGRWGVGSPRKARVMYGWNGAWVRGRRLIVIPRSWSVRAFGPGSVTGVIGSQGFSGAWGEVLKHGVRGRTVGRMPRGSAERLRAARSAPYPAARGSPRPQARR